MDESEPDPPLVGRLGELAAPTLVLIGDRDVDAIAAAAERIARDTPHARVVRWSNVAHLPPLERPPAFEALLLAWVAEVEAG